MSGNGISSAVQSKVSQGRRERPCLIFYAVVSMIDHGFFTLYDYEDKKKSPEGAQI
jgi:hypothetical protein